ncbi:putative lipoprotein YlaJ [Thalassobacillus devorans]|uniref:Lipoprotein YlaJ n=1 Tax=Thalassobacillus devorans TaxID=279813 RepID=A0ABQ1NLR8_9BACI|nr:YhcN/YlaJ family sporulation lipoprotein [Thalassobacillus devorans]NIK27763.1 YhcN/YlaJ family sporulation lipoprotein [Thalassobacillus devorans]GGC80268.1 putative lipoprotein YlaJ [Thalassobacillus devorans]
MKKHMLNALILTALFALTACQNDDPETLQQERDGTEPLMVKDSDPIEKEDRSNQEIAQHLAKLATEVPNVHDATAIVLGPYVVVGIDVDKELDRSRVGTIKYSVGESLKHDPYGKQAVVVADADGVERIRQLNNKLQEGHPVQAISEELSAIVGRYMPEMPIDDDRPEEPDPNKESVPEKEEQKLDEIEEEQSNEHLNKENN